MDADTLKKKLQKQNPLMMSPMAFALAACGGGGGDGKVTTEASKPDDDTAMNTSVFGLNTLGETLSFSYFADNSVRGAVRYFYPNDLDASKGQEVIIAGFETQPNTAAEYSNTALFVLDIDSGGITDITATVLSGDSSSVEGVGDIIWGDFNNDGRLDFFTTAYTDMNFAVNAYSFNGGANGFERQRIDSATWQHGASAFDINGDGYDDVYATAYPGPNLYFGSASGLIEYTVSGVYNGGSGVALGDFLNNGQVQAVEVDAGVVGNDVADTVLFEIFVNDADQTVELKNPITLPAPLLEGDAFDNVLSFSGQRSHDVRVEALDFNNDGLLDVIVFSRSSFDADQNMWPRVSQVQFLRNDGGGVFSDVTSTILPKYDYNSNIGYQPLFDDFNKDGFLDIFISDPDFRGSHTSSVFLLGSSDGSFEEFGRNELTALIPANGGMATVVEDANEDFWLLVGYQSVGVDGRQENLTLHSIDFV